ncbi:hypothetical protein JCM11641_004320 [Rhodosporidiobolus odoratus]
MTMTATLERIPSADPVLASQSTYDIALIGSGILGSALASSLGRSGRTVLLLERDLSEPDRIVGELLQPGGVYALEQLGMGECLDGLGEEGRVECEGYRVFWGDKEVGIPYPEEEVVKGWRREASSSASKAVQQKEKKEGKEEGQEEKKQLGASFHHGRFIQSLRRHASTAKNVTLVEATVNSLLSSSSAESIITGVRATPRGRSDSTPLEYKATLTIVADGCLSKFRRELVPDHVKASTRSHFVGLVLEDADLPAPKHGHVILRQPLSSSSPAPAPTPAPSSESEDKDAPTLGPVLVYQLSPSLPPSPAHPQGYPSETRMLLDIRGPRLPPSQTLPSFLLTHASPILPPSILPSFQKAIEKAEKSLKGEEDKKYRLRSMPNSWLPAHPQGRDVQGALLAGDALNMRHPLTGGGMTVAFSDAVILTSLLGGDETDQVGEIEKDQRGKVQLESWLEVGERLEEWHWRRKGVASCVNVLSLALYSLFGAEGTLRGFFSCP